MNEREGLRERSRRRAVWFAAGVALLAACAYVTALAGDYVFDDVHSVAANPALQHLGNVWQLLSDPAAFSAGTSRMYRPVLLLSFACNLAISPAACSLKAGNVLLHAAVAALVFAWLRRVSRRRAAAFVAAALFAVHPLASEAVNLVSARSELLCVFGLLLGLLGHFEWQRGRARRRAMVGMVAGAVLACGSKETGVVLPVVMLVQAVCLRRDRWDRRSVRAALVGVLPVVATVLAYLVLRKLLLGQATVTLLGRAGDDPSSGYGRSLTTQLATMGTLLPKALAQMVVPVGLSLDPPVHYRSTFADVWVMLGWGSLAGLGLAALWRGTRARARRLGVAFAGAVSLPWIVIPLNMPFAEHRLYGALVGAALVLASLLPRVRLRAWGRLGARQRALLVACCGLVLFGIAGSASRSLLYRDERLLWRSELALHPQSFRAWWGLGTSVFRAGDAASAVEPLAQAHALCPTHYDILRNYCEVLVSLPDERAQPFRAITAAAELAARGPRDPWARTLQAQANLQAGRTTGEREFFETAERLALSCLQIAEPKGYVYCLAAAARRGLGDLEGALAHLDASLGRGLDHFTVHLDRAAVLRELGRVAEARRELLAAQRQAPLAPQVLYALQQWARPPR
ncbi:MAG TPA: hypothetical protein VFZ65_00905 [Planctomycetota bacterium]|nr:hypothetical protein [Planctomycetota bacterium]